ncbi:MAG: molybdate ABC transporter substrate-binding protein [Chitinispirillaceae bacterium]|nr:molybdate ABC transporter substrate-binding protein [Chitinispirillaceae bacterium]
MKTVFITVLFLTALMAGCTGNRKEPAANLLCYVGGTMRPAMEKLAKEFYLKTGITVDIDYSSSGEALIKVRQTGKGDVIVVHDPYEGALRKDSLADMVWNVATLSPVIVVPKGNPKNITGLKDLVTPGMRVVLSDKKYSTLGYIIAAMSRKAGMEHALDSVTVTMTRGSAGAADAVALGTADAAIVWNAVAALRSEKLDTVSVEQKYRIPAGVDAVTSATFGTIDLGVTKIIVASLATSKDKKAARQFGAFLASEEARKVWRDMGFDVNDARGATKTALFIHCASGMRSPMEKIVRQFEAIHGIPSQLSFDGTNRLLSAIELTGKGDIYIAGDADYIEMAAKKNLVDTSVTVCYFEPVIMVQKGNPHDIRTLEDLIRKKVKTGQGDERSAAIGRLMPELLQKNNVSEAAWKQQVVLSTPTVNELALAVQLGTIDATVVWKTIALDYSQSAEIVEIPEDRSVLPAVGAAVLSVSSNKNAARLFLSFLDGSESRGILISGGYRTDRRQ